MTKNLFKPGQFSLRFGVSTTRGRGAIAWEKNCNLAEFSIEPKKGEIEINLMESIICLQHPCN
jgi:hypothetical protein